MVAPVCIESVRVIVSAFTENEDDDENDIWRNLRCNA
jgi:hypothetical protein